MLQAVVPKANISEISNTSNLTTTITNQGKCEKLLGSYYYGVPFAYETSTGWIIALLISGLLNTYAVKTIMKKERCSRNRAFLLNIFIADLSLGSLLYLFLAFRALRFIACISSIVLHITFFIFTNVSLLSLAIIALNHAKQTKNLFTFNRNRSKTQRRIQTLKLAGIWVYSTALSVTVTILFPRSKIWFSQIILILIFIIALHCYSIKKLRKVIAYRSSVDPVLIKRRIKMSKKAQELIIALLVDEVLTWAPLILVVVLHICKAIPLPQFLEASYWCASIVFLAPLFNPIVFLLIRHAQKIRQETRSANQAVEMSPVAN